MIENKKLLQAILIILIPLSFWFLGRFILSPLLLKIPSDFFYQANLISLDNFYDSELLKFKGETRSVTSFSYKAKKENEGFVVENRFQVRTIEGDKIIDIKRNYPVNSFTWKHDKNRSNKEGYLFAPRHLNKSDLFNYWHVNYDRKLTFDFEKEEIIFGLKTYRYKANFPVDQTNNLEHLLGVPEERGVNLDVSLNLWIEPVSGWLIKYHDEAIAYYYDIETGNRIEPWNKFQNSYEPASVLEQVEEAKSRKFLIVFLETYLPLISIFLYLFFFQFKRDKIKSFYLLLIVLITLLLIFFYNNVYKNNESTILIGISKWVPDGNIEYDRNIQGFKDSLSGAGFIEGKSVQYVIQTSNSDHKKQEEIAKSFIEKDLDLIYSLTTPGTLIIKNNIKSKPIIFSVVTYPVETGVVNSLLSSGNNLVGVRNWVSTNDQYQVFRELVPNINSIGFAHRINEPNSIIQFNEMENTLKKFGVELVHIAGIDLEELKSELEKNREKIDALYSACDTLIQGEAEDFIISFVRQNKIPSFSCNISGPQKGDLLGTVADSYEIGRLAGEKAVLVLAGATPSSIETNTVSRPLIFINKDTADLLEIEIPQALRAKAESIIKNEN